MEQLTRLKIGFRIPNGPIRVGTYKFTGDEIILIALTRLHWPLAWNNVVKEFPGRMRWDLQKAFKWFLDFMIVNWAYLIVNNREYWLPFFPIHAEAMRNKLAALPREENRQFFPHADDPNGGYRVAFLIDDTIIAINRVGGGPREGGEMAPRVPIEVQQAWWTGWKKLHGLKWQTVDMPNGMNFDVWGPISVRRNDNYALHHSDIENKLRTLQQDQQLKFAMLGDSAFSNSDVMCSGGGRGMAAIREPIEWDYKDLKTMWKYLDYKHVLHLKKQPVAKIVFVCMLLRNAHVCMNGNQTAQYFHCQPPSFEHWVGQGPRAKPIPGDIIFSNNQN